MSVHPKEKKEEAKLGKLPSAVRYTRLLFLHSFSFVVFFLLLTEKGEERAASSPSPEENEERSHDLDAAKRKAT